MSTVYGTIALFGPRVLENSSENVTLKKEAYLHPTNDAGVETVVESADSAKASGRSGGRRGLG